MLFKHKAPELNVLYHIVGLYSGNMFELLCEPASACILPFVRCGGIFASGLGILQNYVIVVARKRGRCEREEERVRGAKQILYKQKD